AATAGAAVAVVAIIAALITTPLHDNGPADPHPSPPVIPVAPPSGGPSGETQTPEPDQSPPVTPQPSDDQATREEEPRDPESRAQSDPAHPLTREDNSVAPGPTEG
ncbi:hypothetical protein ABGB06_22190, partial [Streptomyces sp. B6B3]